MALFAYFVVYGYYGAITPASAGLRGDILAALLSIGLATPLFLYRAYRSRLEGAYQWDVRITRRELLVAMFALVALLGLTSGRLDESLYSDELSYAASSHGHGIVLALQLARFALFADFEIHYLVQAFGFLLAGFLFIIWMCIGRIDDARIFVFLLIIFGGLRFAFWVRGGNGSPHPPLELLPVFVTGSFFGVNEMGLKISYLLSYFMFLGVVYYLCKREVCGSMAAMIAAAVGTVPLMLSMSTVIEHALWGYIFFTVILLDLYTAKNINYKKLLLVVAFGTLFRQSVFIAVLPLFMVYFLDPARPPVSELRLPRAYWLLPPMALFVPFISRSLLMGTPATESIDKVLRIDQWYAALTSGVTIDSFLSVFYPALAIPFVFSFFPMRTGARSMHIVLLAFFAALWMAYYSIDRGLWGMEKYQAEYFGPFIVLGIFSISITLAKIAGRKVAIGFCIVLLSANLTKFFSDADEVSSSHSVSVSDNYKDAYFKVHELGLAGQTYSIGSTYGILPEIINRYTGSEVRSAQDIYRRQREAAALSVYLTGDIYPILTDHRVNAVLIQSGIGIHDLRANFKAAGWQEVGRFAGGDPGAVVYLLRRPTHGSAA